MTILEIAMEETKVTHRNLFVRWLFNYKISNTSCRWWWNVNVNMISILREY